MSFANKLVAGWWKSENETPSQKPDAVPALSGLEQKQEMLAHMVRLLAMGKSNSLFVVGDGGVGKSRTIQRTLESEGIKPVLLNSHATPMSLYRVLFESREGKVVWLDDADSIYTNLQVLGLLRSATWNDVEPHRDLYLQPTDGHPQPLRFQQQDHLLREPHPAPERGVQGPVSRCDIYTLQATAEEMLEQMRRLAAGGYGSLSPTAVP